MSIKEKFVEAACKALEATSKVKNEYLSYKEAYYRVNTRYRTERDYVAAYEFDLDTLEKFIQEIREVNKALPEDKKVASIRAWKGVSDFSVEFPNVDDLVLVPVTSSGNDLHSHDRREPKAPEAEVGENRTGDELLILSSSRPCPNMCPRRGYLHTIGGNFPPANCNPYEPTIWGTQCSELELIDDKNHFIS